MPEAGYSGVDQPEVRFAQPLVPKAQPLQRSRPVILDKDITPAHQRQEKLTIGSILEVEGNALLATVERGEIGGLPIEEWIKLARIVAAVGVLDLDDAGA